MGMSMHVVGFRPADEKWRQMKAVWDACKAANVFIPKEVDEFFDGKTPDEAGAEVNIMNAVVLFNGPMREGYEVKLDKLPKDVKIIRFYAAF